MFKKIFAKLKFSPVLLVRWPIDDISNVPRFFRKKDEPLFFPTVISGGNVFSTVITSGNLFRTVITSRNVFPTVITSGNVFLTVITTRNNCAWADATTRFIETLIRRSRRKQNIVKSTWSWWDVAYLAALCVLIFAVYIPVWFDKHFNSYAVSTNGYVFHGSLMISNKLTEIHDVCSHK